MTLTIATNTYITIADANAYFTARGNAVWSAATDAQKEKALLEATQYLDGAYTYIGVLSDLEQPLAWPRTGAVITTGNMRGRDFEADEIPQAIKDAACELAVEAISESLMPVGERLVKKEKVDVIEVEYVDWSPSQRTYSFVTLLLRGIIRGDMNNINLVRS